MRRTDGKINEETLEYLADKFVEDNVLEETGTPFNVYLYMWQHDSEHELFV